MLVKSKDSQTRHPRRQHGLSMRLCALAAVAASVFVLAAPAGAGEALEEAILAGAVPNVRSALIAGADPNQVFWPTGMSALTLAAVRGETGVVGLLLEHGADPNWQDHHGVSPLSATVRSCRGNLETLNLLLDAGADIENRSGASLTPVLVAVQEERPRFVKALIDRGADVDAVNAYGDGILNLAIYYRNREVVSLALDKGVDTGQLATLFTTDIYYYPGFGRARPQAASGGCA
jgi:ankyrin repeat protein